MVTRVAPDQGETTENSRPEERYRSTADKAERKNIAEAVLVAHRGQIEAFVRRYAIPERHREEAAQVGVMGLLVALERYDDVRAGPDRGKKSFWGFAFPYVRDEIQRWIDVGVHWRPRTRKVRPGADEATAKAQRRPVSLETPAADTRSHYSVSGGGFANDTLHDRIADNVPGVEELVADFESHERLNEFASLLSVVEREILFSENSQRVRSRRYLLLVERATAFVRGDDGPDRDDVRGSRTSARPHAVSATRVRAARPARGTGSVAGD